MPKPLSILATVAAASLALAACGRDSGNDLAAMDNELLANGVDPALTSALEDQILVDPNLVQQANPNTIRPAEAPVQAQYPAGSARSEAALASMHQAGRASGASAGQATAGPCGSTVPFDHGPQWARRLPAEFPLYPGGRLTDAAGSDSGDCRMRVVTFTTADPYARVLEHYRSLAARGGFTAEHQQRGTDHVLGGVNARNDGAYYLIVTPRPQGSEVALIANNGR